MDSFAVSLAGGLSSSKCKLPQIFRAAIFFGLFHALFAYLGWLLSQSFKELIEQVDHWIAFDLLLGIGGKMVWESVRVPPDKRSFIIERIMVLSGLSIAISLDSLIVGMGAWLSRKAGYTVGCGDRINSNAFFNSRVYFGYQKWLQVFRKQS